VSDDRPSLILLAAVLAVLYIAIGVAIGAAIWA
jgi:hypothetical protein